MKGEDLGKDWGNDATPIGGDLGADWGNDAVPEPAAPASQYGTSNPRDVLMAKKLYLARQILRGTMDAGRAVVAGPLAVAEGAVRTGGDLAGSALQKLIPGANPTGVGGPGIDWAPGGFTGAVSDAWKKRNEGFREIGSNPLNVLGLVPALAPARLAAAAGATSPLWRAALATGIGAAEGGAVGGTQAAYEGGDVLPAIARGALGSAILTGGGEMLNQWGRSSFPGLSARYNRHVPDASKQLVRENADEILSAGVLPKSREGFLSQAAQQQQALGRRYNEAAAAVPEDWRYDLAQLDDDARVALEKRLTGLGRAGMVYHEGLPLPGGAAGPTLPFATAPEDALAVLASKVNNVKGTQLARGKNTQALNARELADYRTALTNPEADRDPSGVRTLMLKDVGKSWRDASNDALMSAPNYAEVLGADTPRRYAMWSTLEDLVEHPGNLGLQHRAPILNLAIDPWKWSSAIYKGGNAIKASAIPAAALSGRLGAPATGNER